MRIIGGIFKGRNLTAFDCDKIRPTSDMARESLFNILRDKVTDCAFLDLFGGTGAVGIEALSRGASNVVIVEAYKDSLKVAQKNLDIIKNPEGIKLINRDAVGYLIGCGESFDIIFIDPPYKSDIISSVFKAISEGDVLKTGGVVVIETETPYVGETYSLSKCDERKYGRARFAFFKMEQK